MTKVGLLKIVIVFLMLSNQKHRDPKTQ